MWHFPWSPLLYLTFLFFLLKIFHFYHVYLHVCECLLHEHRYSQRPEEGTGGPSVAVTGSPMRMLGIELWSSGRMVSTLSC